MREPIQFPARPARVESQQPEPRVDRAARLRPAVAERVAALGARAVARATGLSDSAVRAFVNDEKRLPLPGALDAYEELLAAHADLGGDGPPARPAEGEQRAGGH